ncbi:hypothetical protein COT98_03575 [Candidatus Falkowbacteria bacterium CG10_big_fil_rev_8_21_14_0_10_39_9]|uniref:Prepilin-type N-terminal cleavage/methylation domain-containing protein n=1 Tax=Candidatus Falkowbacteria bacterium CG10_big_fil_rev_8_21_14_0_10_39_9 TaxID=1974566 RepID=A0A2M6WNY4_9BACT|nr:MAG: hypothetical protein COT98_03575 [Candidatus Falkowbacteria bacterium CG10_big_fil_rev_8_21_14_0_10_39_9]
MVGNTKQSAFTLLEVIVSVAIFAVIILAATQIFQSVISSQVKNFSETSLQDDAKYFLEVFTREARGAQKNTTAAALCDDIIATSSTYVVTHGALYFQNNLGDCVRYYSKFDADGVNRLVLQRNDDSYYLSSNKIDIDNLSFVVADESNIQPLVTMNLTVKSKVNLNLPALNIQTSINSGWYAN